MPLGRRQRHFAPVLAPILALKAAPARPKARFVTSRKASPTGALAKKLQSLIPGDLKIPQKAYVWALRNSNLTAVISELITHEHVKDNVALAAKRV